MHKTYKERSQPEGRRQLGPLEKHKDYVKRAAATNKSKKELKRLKILARDRNVDEFNYRMLSEIKLRKNDEEETNDYVGEKQKNLCDLHILRIKISKLQKELEECVQKLAFNSSLRGENKSRKVEKIKNKIERIESQISKFKSDLEKKQMKNNFINAKIKDETYYEFRDPETDKPFFKWKAERKK